MGYIKNKSILLWIGSVGLVLWGIYNISWVLPAMISSEKVTVSQEVARHIRYDNFIVILTFIYFIFILIVGIIGILGSGKLVVILGSVSMGISMSLFFYLLVKSYMGYSELLIFVLSTFYTLGSISEKEKL